MECSWHCSVACKEGESAALGSIEQGITTCTGSSLLLPAATGRNLTALLQALPGNLTLHEADLLEKGSFDEVVKVSVVQPHTCIRLDVKAQACIYARLLKFTQILAGCRLRLSHGVAFLGLLGRHTEGAGRACTEWHIDCFGKCCQV